MKIFKIATLAVAAFGGNMRSIRRNAYMKHWAGNDGISRRNAHQNEQQNFDKITWFIKRYKAGERAFTKSHKREIYNKYFSQFVRTTQN